MPIPSFVPTLVICASISAVSAQAAVTEDNFLVKNAGDLVELCSAEPSDPLYTAARHFCEGFAVGAYRVLEEENGARAPSHRLFCPPNPAPTRDKGIASFVQWARADASRLALGPADGVFAFLSSQYPCPAGR